MYIHYYSIWPLSTSRPRIQPHSILPLRLRLGSAGHLQVSSWDCEIIFWDQISFRFLSDFFQISFRFLSDFFQISFRFLSDFFQISDLIPSLTFNQPLMGLEKNLRGLVIELNRRYGPSAVWICINYRITSHMKSHSRTFISHLWPFLYDLRILRVELSHN